MFHKILHSLCLNTTYINNRLTNTLTEKLPIIGFKAFSFVSHVLSNSRSMYVNGITLKFHDKLIFQLSKIRLSQLARSGIRLVTLADIFFYPRLMPFVSTNIYMGLNA